MSKIALVIIEIFQIWRLSMTSFSDRDVGGLILEMDLAPLNFLYP